MNKIGLVPGIELAAQAADMGFDNIGFGIKMKIPDVFKQHGASDHLSGMTDQDTQAGETRSAEDR